MRATYSCLIIAILISAACNQTQQHRIDMVKKKAIHHHAPKSAQTVTDTLIISSASAVFLLPDSLRIEKEKKAMGEENFSTVADDYSFYTYQADSILKSKGLTIVNNAAQKFVKFIKADNSSKLIKIDTLTAAWNVYLFTPSKNPVNADITDIESHYKAYFK